LESETKTPARIGEVPGNSFSVPEDRRGLGFLPPLTGHKTQPRSCLTRPNQVIQVAEGRS
jgi:hypothetical protein